MDSDYGRPLAVSVRLLPMISEISAIYRRWCEGQ